MNTLRIIYRQPQEVEPKTSAVALIRISKTTKKRVDVRHDPILAEDLRWQAHKVATLSAHVTLYKGDGWSIRLNRI